MILSHATKFSIVITPWLQAQRTSSQGNHVELLQHYVSACTECTLKLLGMWHRMKYKCPFTGLESILVIY